MTIIFKTYIKKEYFMKIIFAFIQFFFDCIHYCECRVRELIIIIDQKRKLSITIECIRGRKTVVIREYALDWFQHQKKCFLCWRANNGQKLRKLAWGNFLKMLMGFKFFEKRVMVIKCHEDYEKSLMVLNFCNKLKNLNMVGLVLTKLNLYVILIF